MRVAIAILLFVGTCSAQLSIRQPAYVAAILKPTASAAASYPSGATHYWAFADNLNDGVGAFTLTDADASYVAGKNGQCLVVEPAETVTTDANSLPATTAFSIVQWVYVTTGALPTFNLGTAGLTMNVADGVVTAKVGSLADDMVSDPYTLDAWTLVVVTYDGTSVEKLSVNGATFVTGTVTTEGAAGAMSWTGSDADLRVDELATFTRALTQQEVTDIYNSGTGRFGP